MYKKLLGILIIFLLCSCTGSPSENDGALKYRNGKCLVYYPNNQRIKEYAQSLCEDGMENTFDYEVKDLGDMYLVSYPYGLSFYTEKDYSDLSLIVSDRLDILSSELRYQMKEKEIDLAYTSDFALDTDPENLDTDNVKVEIDNDELVFYFPQYDFEVYLPLSIGQQVVSRNFGLDDVNYVKRNYVSKNRPMVALTFDDGPYKTVDTVLYDTLNKYDARATFYFVGSRFSENEIEFSKTGINMGMEYGSHTENHENLADYSAADAKQLVCEVSDYFYEKLGYQMKTYRPPYGSRNESLEEIIDMTAILWNCDSEDWRNRDEELTYYNVMNTISDGDIVLLHSLYESTAQACKRIIPELIDEGYQLVTVSELLESLHIEAKTFRGQ